MNLSTRKLTLLLVEDSKEDVLLFRLQLAKTGITASLLVESNGKAAIDFLSKPGAQHELDIIFLDLKMPMVGGFEVLRWVREQNFVPPLQIVVLSGSPHEGDEALARELGASDYVVKPIGAEDLQRRLALLADGPIPQA